MSCRGGAERHYAGKQRQHEDARDDNTSQESKFDMPCAEEVHLHSHDEAKVENYVKV
jgi:hypothetical protein